MRGFSVRVTRSGLRFYAERKLAGRPCRFDCGKWGSDAQCVSLTKAEKSREKPWQMLLLKDRRPRRKLQQISKGTERWKPFHDGYRRLPVTAMQSQYRLTSFSRRCSNKPFSSFKLDRSLFGTERDVLQTCDGNGQPLAHTNPATGRHRHGGAGQPDSGVLSLLK